MNNFKKIIIKIIMQVPFIFYSLTVIAPLAFLVVTPFRNNEDIIHNGLFSIPTIFTFNNIIHIWSSNFVIGFRNSMFLAVVGTILALMIGSLASYALAFLKFIGNKVFYNLVFFGIYISLIVIVMPLFLQYGNLNLINNIFAALIIYIGLRLPFTIFLFRNFFGLFPQSMVDSAKIDGANSFGIFTRIVIPLSKPIIVTIAIFNFLAVWADVLIGILFLQTPELKILMPSILESFFINQRQPGEVVVPTLFGYAGLLIATIPVALIFVLGKKYYIQALTLGSIK